MMGEMLVLVLLFNVRDWMIMNIINLLSKSDHNIGHFYHDIMYQFLLEYRSDTHWYTECILIHQREILDTINDILNGVDRAREILHQKLSEDPSRKCPRLKF